MVIFLYCCDKMEVVFKWLWLLLALLALRARADCTSYGVDYSNGGSYYIDSTSNQYFSFITVFQGNGSIPPKISSRCIFMSTVPRMQPRVHHPHSHRARWERVRLLRHQDSTSGAASDIYMVRHSQTQLRTLPLLTQPISGIPFSVMRSGTWKIIVAGSQISSQRVIALTVGAPQTTWYTVCTFPAIVQLVMFLSANVQRQRQLS